MKGLSIAGLILGIIATVFFWWPGANFVFLALGITGIVLSAISSSRAKAVGAPTGLATAGLVLSIIGTCLCGIGFFTCTLCVAVGEAATLN